jgi:hypothetical protein
MYTDSNYYIKISIIINTDLLYDGFSSKDTQQKKRINKIQIKLKRNVGNEKIV